MLGPYTANKDRTLTYKGNRVFPSIPSIDRIAYPTAEVEERVAQFVDQPFWGHIARVNHRINMATNEYFDAKGALFTALPLTTRMISSPGAVYGKEAISYTTDTSPITLRWFDQKRKAFLSESSQIYLELALMQQGVDHVYSVYNSFRKEEADPTHLSEFHHIEYEGKITQPQNRAVALGLVGHIVTELLEKEEQSMSHFLSSRKLQDLQSLATDIHSAPQLTYREALNLLFDATKDERYKAFTMQGNFGSWEEVKLTELVGSLVGVSQFPLLEVPFYHAMVDGVEEEWLHHEPYQIVREARTMIGSGMPTLPMIPPSTTRKRSHVADNTDFIWPGYRETVGSGHRVRSKNELEEKARIFQLPKDDYVPYMQTRQFDGYKETSGFGLGWERLLQGVLEMPFIWTATQFPRGHTTLKP